MAVVGAKEGYRTRDLGWQGCARDEASTRTEFGIDFDACGFCYLRTKRQLEEKTAPRKPRTRRPENAEAKR